MKRFFTTLGIVIIFQYIVLMLRYLYKWYLLLRLKTDTHMGFEYYWALKKYKEFEP
jgi:hypothetical protein